ncbi:putative rhamnosyl transferase [Cognatishimia sp. WU-CL00825]|uniref:putative rhamnosyl transferase n=1 Tax=Cognatishimia sp. WU-CL00825 TaxID=3127658 RepID=UPI0033654354
MSSQDMQVVGLCRFSYPALGGFQVEHETIEDRRAYLYAPERMEERFRTFETIALPGLKAQTDPNFELLIVVGDCMPAPYLERLAALTQDFPQAVIVQRAPERHRPAMQRVLNDFRRDTGLHTLQFRHDDDDAVAVNFIERLRDVAQDCQGLLARNRLMAIDFNRGFSARPTAQGLEAEPAFLPYYGVAFGMAVAPSVKQSIMNFGHNKVHRVMPTITHTDEDMFVRGHNDFNDSRQKANVSKVDLQPLDAAGEAHFKARFAIDADQVRAAFA